VACPGSGFPVELDPKEGQEPTGGKGGSRSGFVQPPT
jgi:hypothetical protein